MNAFGFSYEMEISTKPEKSIGSDAVWEQATEALKGALNRCGISYKIDEGAGHFMVPKLILKSPMQLGESGSVALCKLI